MQMSYSKESFIQQLVSAYRRSHKGWCYDKNHVCSQQTCDLVQIKASLLPNGTIVKGKSPNALHVVDTLFICKETGKEHYCCQQCDGGRFVSDSGYVCCISGIQYDTVRVDCWRPSKRITSTHQENKDPLKLLRTSNGFMKFEFDKNKSIRDQQHILIAKNILQTLLFSKKRLFSEQRKYLEMKREAEKMINKYVRQCERNKKMIVFTRMINIYVNQINRRRMFRDLVPTFKSKDDIIQLYAHRCQRCWEIITTKTQLGVQYGNLFNIKTFIPSILYIMKRGLNIFQHSIIPKDYYLESILPEANTLDNYDIHKPSFTQCKNNILKAFRDTYESRKIDMKELSIQPIN